MAQGLADTGAEVVGEAALGVTADGYGRVKWLELDGNDLSGPIPPEIGNLRALKWLSLDYNRLSGPIPPEIGSLAALEWLQLSVNELSGPIPPEIGSLAALKYLSLGQNPRALAGSAHAKVWTRILPEVIRTEK